MNTTIFKDVLDTYGTGWRHHLLRNLKLTQGHMGTASTLSPAHAGTPSQEQSPPRLPSCPFNFSGLYSRPPCLHQGGQQHSCETLIRAHSTRPAQQCEDPSEHKTDVSVAHTCQSASLWPSINGTSVHAQGSGVSTVCACPATFF